MWGVALRAVAGQPSFWWCCLFGCSSVNMLCKRFEFSFLHLDLSVRVSILYHILLFNMLFGVLPQSFIILFRTLLFSVMRLCVVFAVFLIFFQLWSVRAFLRASGVSRRWRSLLTSSLFHFYYLLSKYSYAFHIRIQ